MHCDWDSPEILPGLFFFLFSRWLPSYFPASIRGVDLTMPRISPKPALTSIVLATFLSASDTFVK